MLATECGVALVRRASPQPANDNTPGTITPDDAPFFIALGLMCAGVVALLAYVVMSGSGDLMTAALRR